MLISRSLSHTSSVTPAIGAVWILAAFFIWGIAFGWVYRRISLTHVAAAADLEDVTEPPGAVERLDRRRFLIRLGGATATITVGGVIVGALTPGRRNRQSASVSDLRWSASYPLPNADAAVKPAPGTRPEYTPLEQHYRIDINTLPPRIDGRQWRLKIHGLVARPVTLTLKSRRRRPYRYNAMDRC